MKRIWKAAASTLMAALIILYFCVPALAAQSSVVVDGVTYNIKNNTGTAYAEIVEWDGKTGAPDLSIPAQISAGGLIPVTAIGPEAFKGQKDLKTISFGSAAVTAGKSAFQGCSSLTSVSVAGPVPGPGTLTLAENVFMNCAKLKQLNFAPQAVNTTVPRRAFLNCYSLEQIPPLGIVAIKSEAFSGCANLLNLRGTTPKEISDLAFGGCLKLSEIDLSQTTKIESQAFYDCRELKNVNLSKATDIGIRAFLEAGLTSVTLPEGAAGTAITIGRSAFAGCTGLTSVDFTTVQAGRLAVGDEAFYGCSELNKAKFNQTLSRIGSGVFTNTKIDPKNAGGIAKAGTIDFVSKDQNGANKDTAGMQTDWTAIPGTNEYSTFHVTFNEQTVQWDPGIKPTNSPTSSIDPDHTPAPSPASTPTLWVSPAPTVDDDWVEIDNITPESGDTITVTATARQGQISYQQIVMTNGSAVCKLDFDGRKRMLLDASNIGYGYGASSFKSSGIITGRPGDSVDITIEGTYSYGGTSYAISKKLPRITIQNSLDIKTTINDVEGEPKNVQPTDKVVLSAVWGAPPTGIKTYEWSCDPADGVTMNAVNANDTGERTFEVSKAGRYVVTCTGKTDSGVTSQKKIDITVSSREATIEDTGMVNMQPQDRATLTLRWRDNPPSDSIVTYQWSAYPDNNAFLGDTNKQAVVFAPSREADYTISCTVTVQVPTDPSRGFTQVYTKGPVKVQRYTLSFEDGSPDPQKVVSVKDQVPLKVAWAPAWDTTDQTVKPTYSWRVTSGGADKTQEALEGVVPSSDQATFRPLENGTYTIRCEGTYQIPGSKIIKSTAQVTIKVGYGLTVTPDKDLTEQLKPGESITFTATLDPKGSLADSDVKWTVNSAALELDKTEGLTVTATPKQPGTYVIACTAGSGTGAAKETKKFVVANNPMSLNATPGPDPDSGAYAVGTEIQLTAGGTFPAGTEYVWSCSAGADFVGGTPGTGSTTATFKAAREGTFLVTCIAYEVNDTTKREIGRAQISILIRDKAGTSSSNASLEIASSVPDRRIRTDVPVVLTASWKNGIPDPNVTLDWSYEPAQAVNTAELVPDQKAPAATFKSSAPGTYTIKCKASNNEEASILIEVYESAILRLGWAMIAPDATTGLDGPEQDPGDNKGNGETTVDPQSTAVSNRILLRPIWEGKENTTGIGYVWAVDGDYTGNVTNACLDGPLSNENPSDRIFNLKKLLDAKLPNEVQNSQYTVTCTATGHGVPAETRACVARFVIKIDGRTPVVQSAGTPVVTKMSLSQNAPVRLKNAANENALRVTGLSAASADHNAWTVQHVLDSFVPEGGQSVVVSDKDGNVRADGEARIVTGDKVQLLDDNGNLIEEATVVLMGDMLGTGQINLSQLVIQAKGMKDESALAGAYREAGDWDSNGRINLSDLVWQAGELKK